MERFLGILHLGVLLLASAIPTLVSAQSAHAPQPDTNRRNALSGNPPMLSIMTDDPNIEEAFAQAREKQKAKKDTERHLNETAIDPETLQTRVINLPLPTTSFSETKSNLTPRFIFQVGGSDASQAHSSYQTESELSVPSRSVGIDVSHRNAQVEALRRNAARKK